MKFQNNQLIKNQNHKITHHSRYKAKRVVIKSVIKSNNGRGCQSMIGSNCGISQEKIKSNK